MTVATSPEAAGAADPLAISESELAALSEEDRQAILLCRSVIRLQEAGVEFVEASAAPTGDLAGLAEKLAAALRGLSAQAPPDTRAILDPVASEATRVANRRTSAEAMVAEFGAFLGRSGPQISEALRQLIVTCPGQLDAEDLDQAERFQLGAPGLPT